MSGSRTKRFSRVRSESRRPCPSLRLLKSGLIASASAVTTFPRDLRVIDARKPANLKVLASTREVKPRVAWYGSGDPSLLQHIPNTDFDVPQHRTSSQHHIRHNGILLLVRPLGIVVDQVGDVRESRPYPSQEDRPYILKMGYLARKHAEVGAEARQVPRQYAGDECQPFVELLQLVL